MNRKELSEMPRISEHVKNKFINAVKKHHGGTKWRVLKQEIEKALLYYIEVGPLADEYIIEDETTGDVEKIKLTTSAFFKLFDNEHVYVYDRITVDYIKGIVAKITDNESDYNWRQWSTKIYESGRLRQLKGTKDCIVARDKFNFIEEELKEYYDVTIKGRQSESYNISTNRNDAWRIYNKLVPGQTISLTEICKIGDIPEKEGKAVIKQLMNEYKFQFITYGKWKVLDPAAAKTLKENSLKSKKIKGVNE